MQQLTLQFEGYADSRRPETQGTAKQCQVSEIYKAFRHLTESLVKSVTKPSRRIFLGWLRKESALFSQFAGERVSRLNAICGTAAVVFSFVIVSFAVIIGG